MQVPCTPGGFDGVSVMLSTYARAQPGRATVEIIEPSGQTTATGSVDTATLVDNDQNRFMLSRPACQSGTGAVIVRLSFHPGAPGAMIAAWQYPEWHGTGFMVRTLRARPEGDVLQLVSRDASTNVILWRNPSAAERAFLAPIVRTVSTSEDAMTGFGTLEVDDLQRVVFTETPGACRGNPSFPRLESPGRLEKLDLSANAVQIDYDASSAGVLTLTDAHARGWRATLDGREVPLLRVDGVFRGVCLNTPGRHRVEFSYRPPHWNFALLLCGIGAIGVGARARWSGPSRQRRPLATAPSPAPRAPD
jgi:hypothetical protein